MAKAYSMDLRERVLKDCDRDCMSGGHCGQRKLWDNELTPGKGE